MPRFVRPVSTGGGFVFSDAHYVPAAADELAEMIEAAQADELKRTRAMLASGHGTAEDQARVERILGDATAAKIAAQVERKRLRRLDRYKTAHAGLTPREVELRTLGAREQAEARATDQSKADAEMKKLVKRARKSWPDPVWRAAEEDPTTPTEEKKK